MLERESTLQGFLFHDVCLHRILMVKEERNPPLNGKPLLGKATRVCMRVAEEERVVQYTGFFAQAKG